jgi:hypothetical protein
VLLAAALPTIKKAICIAGLTAFFVGISTPSEPRDRPLPTKEAIEKVCFCAYGQIYKYVFEHPEEIVSLPTAESVCGMVSQILDGIGGKDVGRACLLTVQGYIGVNRALGGTT